MSLGMFAAVAAGSASLLSVRKCPSRSRLHKECRPHRAVQAVRRRR